MHKKLYNHLKVKGKNVRKGGWLLFFDSVLLSRSVFIKTMCYSRIRFPISSYTHNNTSTVLPHRE